MLSASDKHMYQPVEGRDNVFVLGDTTNLRYISKAGSTAHFEAKEALGENIAALSFIQQGPVREYDDKRYFILLGLVMEKQHTLCLIITIHQILKLQPQGFIGLRQLTIV